MIVTEIKMGTLNVNRNVADAFYRYKMPRICAKVEGKGNGIKTVIVNMIDVAKALGRPATYPTKYFGCELGAQTQFDFKNERFIVNGSHDASKLQDLLDGFIRKFVLCPECDNPETDLIVSIKRGTISQGCKACGYHGVLDFNHKLNTFILKNPPDTDPATQGSSLTEGNRGKRSKKAANGDHNTSQDVNSSHNDTKNDDGGDVPSTPTTPAPKKNEDDDTKWTVDVSEEAVRARLQDLTEGAKCMTLTDDLEKNEKQRMDIFHAYLKRRIESGDINTQKANTEILHEAERLDVKSKAVMVVCELLVRPTALAADVRRARALLLRFTHEDARAQRALLGAVEIMCGEGGEPMLVKVPAILKLLYDMDIIEEQSLLEWAGKPSKKYVSRELAVEIRKRADPFVQWLREADEEDSSAEGESGEEDFEIEYNDRAKATPMTAQAQTKATRPAEDDGEGDVDIDAI